MSRPSRRRRRFRPPTSLLPARLRRLGTPEPPTASGTSTPDRVQPVALPAVAEPAPELPSTAGDAGQPFGESRFRRRPGHPDTIKPSVAADGFHAGPLTVRAASVRGDAHRTSGSREDDYRIAVDRGAASLVLAVADGVSAAPHAAVGSCLAVEASIDALIDRPCDLMAAIQSAITALHDQAERWQVPPQSLATSLAVGAVDLTPPHAATFRTLGNTGVVELAPEGRWLLTGGATEEATQALPVHDEHHSDAAEFVVGDNDGLLVMTDGIGDVLREAQVRAWLDARWRHEIPSTYAFAEQVGIEHTYQWDDRTVVGIWPRNNDPRDDT